jgi:hypothetical protein
MQAVLTEDGDPVENGLTWRVFHPNPGNRWQAAAAGQF